MIYTVTFNPAIDYVVNVNNFRTEQLNRTDEEEIFPGGKGINVSIVLKNMGISNIALGFLSGFTGKMIEQMLAETGCVTDFVYVRSTMSRINIKLKSDLQSKLSNETEINGRGPCITEENVSELYKKLDKLEAGDILVLAGSIPKSMDNDIYGEIMKRLSEKEIKIVVDATGKLLMNVLKYHPFLIKPNKQELEEIFGTRIENGNDVKKYALKLRKMGAVNVLVSMAGEGAVLIDENGKIHESAAPKGKVINSVGAGDSMVAGFIAGYLQNASYDNAFKMGIATGSASAFSKYLASKEEVEKLFKQL